MPIIRLPNGEQVRFPEGMSDEDMAKAISSNYPQFAPEAAPAAAPAAAAAEEPSLWNRAKNAVGEVASTAADALIGIPASLVGAVSGPNPDGVMGEAAKRGQLGLEAVPANVGPYSREGWARVKQRQADEPLDPRLVGIKPGDAVARAEQEAALRPDGNAAKQRVVARASSDNAQDKLQDEMYSAANLAGNTADNVRNFAASSLKIGPTALKGGADIARLFTGDNVGKDTSELMAQGMKGIDQLVASQRMNDQHREFSQLMADDSAGVGDLFSYLIDNPAIMADAGITTIGSMFLPAGAAKLGVLGARGLGLGQAGVGRAAAVASGATVAAQNAADTFTDDSLAKSSMGDRYTAATISAALTVLSGMAFKGGAEGEIAKRMAGELRAGRTTVDAVKGYIKAALNEGAQEAGEELGGMLGKSAATLEAPSMNNAVKQLAFAGTLGAMFGAATHGSSAGVQDDGSAAAEQARAEALGKWNSNGLTSSRTDASGRTAPTWKEATSGAVDQPERREPSMDDIAKASSVDGAIEAAMAVASAPAGASPYPTAADVDALEEQAAPGSLLAAAGPRIPVNDLDGIDLTADIPALTADDPDQGAEPPLAPGMTRLYHGGDAGRYDGDAWYSTDRKYAEGYAAKDGRTGTEVQYVDYPTDKINKHADPDGYGQTPDKGFHTTIELPSSETGQRKPLSPKPANLPNLASSDDSADWYPFPPESQTLGLPRAEMPQIKAEHRGAMVNFLNARGISHEQVEIDANDLKPTQREFSVSKVQKAIDFEGGNRSILVSSDGHVLDGHHQWMASAEKGEPVKAIRLNAPIRQLLDTVREFPSAGVDTASAPQGPDTHLDAAREKHQRQDDAVRAAAESLEKRKSTGGQRARDRLKQSNPFLGFLASHGINIADRSDTGGEKGRKGGVMIPGYGPMYRKSGKRLDELAQLALEAGFLTQQDIDEATDTGGTRKLADMIARAVQGKEVIRTAGLLDAVAPSADQRLIAEAQRLGVDTSDKTADQLYDAVTAAHEAEEARREVSGANMDEQEEIDQLDAGYSDREAQLVAELMRDADIPLDGGASSDTITTDEDLDAIFGIQSRRAGETAGQAENGTAAPANEADAPAGQPGQEGQDLLTSYTPEEVLARDADAAARAKAEKAEADKLEAQRKKEQGDKETRARADATVDDFQLGQDATAQLSGQRDIFGAPAAPAPAASTPTFAPDADGVILLHGTVVKFMDGSKERTGTVSHKYTEESQAAGEQVQIRWGQFDPKNTNKGRSKVDLSDVLEIVTVSPWANDPAPAPTAIEQEIARAKGGKKAAPEVAITDELLDIAKAETAALDGVMRLDMESDQQGIVVGMPTNINYSLKKGRYTLEQMSAGWARTRAYLRDTYGDTVTLFRADAPRDKWSADTQVVYMGDKALAQNFANRGRTVEAFTVPVDDVIGMNVQRNGYYEFIVKKQVPALDQEVASAKGGKLDNATAPEQLHTDFMLHAVDILTELGRRGELKALYKAGAARNADTFGGMPLSDQADAYVKLVQGGVEPVAITEDYNTKVSRMERDAEVRRFQSDSTVRQRNGKPFASEKTAAAFQEEYDLGDTHEVVPAEGKGFELKRLAPARRPSAIRAVQERQAADPETIRQEAAFARAKKLGRVANAAVEWYENGDITIDEFEGALSELEPKAAPAEDDGADIPRSFFKKVKVPMDVYIEDEQRWETVEVTADKALKSVNEDIDNLEAMLKCMKG